MAAVRPQRAAPEIKYGRVVRPEIQALRAVAVATVVVCHVWPSVLPGGFVGVDVFFAISGFLITSHLLREIDRHDGVSLAAFWARRARRILPAALFVIAICAVATLALVPANHWGQWFDEMRASTLYVQNWQLAADAVDYFAAENEPSVVQHFWSLSAEEQFYLVWPLLLLAGVAATRRRPRWRLRALGVAMGGLVAVSFAYGLYLTVANPAAAYFITPTRAWEFGAGGLLALSAQTVVGSARVRAVVSWAGLAAIAIASATFSGETPFPGAAALLPVLGTLAVIWAGAPALRWAPTPLMERRPVQFLGDISYSVYLWHWPLLILMPFVLEREIPLWMTFVIVALTILAAWLTKLVVEDPVRSGRFLTRRPPRFTFASVGAATLLVLTVIGAGFLQLREENRKAASATARILANPPECFGAESRDPERRCSNPELRLVVAPTPSESRSRRNAPCKIIERTPTVCRFGVSRAKAEDTIALVGDSHAAHWRAALDVVVREKQWRGLSLTHTSCPFSKATEILTEPSSSECLRWKEQVFEWFERHPEVTTVFVGQVAGGRGVVRPPGADNTELEIAGYLGAWDALPDSVERVIVLRDTPKIQGRTLACIQAAIDDDRPAGPKCAESRAGALDTDTALAAAERVPNDRAVAVDLLDHICDARRCYPVVGGALVYKDRTHLTTVFAETLGPYLLRQVERLDTAAKR